MIVLHRFTGYRVLTSWGHTERGALRLTRRDDGRWHDGGHDVVFQESDELPAEGWTCPPASIWDRGLKHSVRAVAAVYEDEGAFVIDSAGVEWLLQHDPAAIDWLADYAEWRTGQC
jgi:hypothetical protein